MNTKKTLTIFLIGLTVLLAIAAIFVGLRLRQEKPTTPDETEASGAGCCSVPGVGSACGPEAVSCEGGDPTSACATGKWCWCATVTNECVNDTTGEVEGSIEIFCGNDNITGTVCYGCPAGWHPRDGGSVQCTTASQTNCGTCNPTTPPVTTPPACTNKPTMEISTDGGQTFRSATSVAIDRTVPVILRFNGNGMDYLFSAVNGAGLAGSTCGSVASGSLPACGSTWSVDFSDATFWGNNPRLVLDGQQNGQIANGCSNEIAVTFPVVTTPPVTTPPVTTPPVTTPPADIDIDVEKTAGRACPAGTNTAVLTYTITVTNNSETDANDVEVTDNIQDSIATYVNESSITGGGVLQEALDDSGWVIVWNVDLGGEESAEFTFNVTLPSSFFGQSITNVAGVIYGNGDDNSVVTTNPVVMTVSCTVLPETALVSDWADRIMIGIVLIILGALSYRLDLMNKLGLIKFFSKIDPDVQPDVTDRDVEKFERRILKDDE